MTKYFGAFVRDDQFRRVEMRINSGCYLLAFSGCLPRRSTLFSKRVGDVEVKGRKAAAVDAVAHIESLRPRCYPGGENGPRLQDRELETAKGKTSQVNPKVALTKGSKRHQESSVVCVPLVILWSKRGVS